MLALYSSKLNTTEQKQFFQYGKEDSREHRMIDAKEAYKYNEMHERRLKNNWSSNPRNIVKS